MSNPTVISLQEAVDVDAVDILIDMRRFIHSAVVPKLRTIICQLFWMPPFTVIKHFYVKLLYGRKGKRKKMGYHLQMAPHCKDVGVTPI
ncbi:hypothetical protein [Pelobacter propionicus]|uniref:Uncharacterized protein n=1 Tax=Pelobacter propionicus (strain DSM 2379 / NBRC 103807 / OttBd1) TaxID=338966 RepID=A0R824_PELPD|nr:hypothetical protein [Pelobacter propionicus]ABL01259.1 hypothetical protein Ppro_3667 [Pelobacter propionicus DSM 2379]